MYAECIEGTQRTYPPPKLVHVSSMFCLEGEGEGKGEGEGEGVLLESGTCSASAH